jgi:hypothetical protein
MATPKKVPDLVGFVGVKGSGKDSAAEALKQHNFVCVALADPLREAVRALFKLGPEHMDVAGKEKPGPLGVSYRRGMQRVGTDLIRNQLKTLLPEMHGEAGELWVEHLRITVKELRSDNRRVAVTDVRFPDEAQAILDMGGTLLCLSRPPIRLAEFCAVMGWEARDDHPSETGIEKILEEFGCHPNTLHIANSGSLEDLRSVVRACVGL